MKMTLVQNLNMHQRHKIMDDRQQIETEWKLIFLLSLANIINLTQTAFRLHPPKSWLLNRPSARTLGIVFDNALSMDDHNKICAKLHILSNTKHKWNVVSTQSIFSEIQIFSRNLRSFYRKITQRHSKIGFSRKYFLKKQRLVVFFFFAKLYIGLNNNSFTVIENNNYYRFLK